MILKPLCTSLHRRFAICSGVPSCVGSHFGIDVPMNLLRSPFSSSRSNYVMIREAVDEFINARRLELERYQSANQPDGEQASELLRKLSSVDLGDSTSFPSVGLDGLDEVELILMIESKLGITLSDSDFHSIHSIADAVRVINRAVPSEGQETLK